MVDTPTSPTTTKATTTTKVTSKKDKEDQKILNQFTFANTRDTKIKTNQKLFFFFVALISSFLPSYLFQSVLDLELTAGTSVLYLLVSIASAFLLHKAYILNFIRNRTSLNDKYEKVFDNTKGSWKTFTKEEKNQIYVKKAQLADLGAIGLSLFLSNLLFLVFSLFLSFYALKRMDVRVNYVISLLLGALGVQLMSQPKQKKNKQQ
ncbi:hypothetical protein ABK040_002708 [Willaertia magna]